MFNWARLHDAEITDQVTLELQCRERFHSVATVFIYAYMQARQHTVYLVVDLKYKN